MWLFILVLFCVLIYYKLIISQQFITLKNGLGTIYCPYCPDVVCDTTRFTNIWEENIQNEFEKQHNEFLWKEGGRKNIE